MALEDLTGPAKFISALVPGNPVSNDDRREGDDHIRGIKNTLVNTFPGLNGAVTATDEELNAAGAGAYPGNLSAAGSIHAGGDISAGGNLSAVGGLAVGGAATIGGDVVAPNFYAGTTDAAHGVFGIPSTLGGALVAWGNTAPGAGRVDLSTQGVARLTASAAGNVGIGTPNPDARLHVAGPFIHHSNGSNNLYLGGAALVGGTGPDSAIRFDGGNLRFSAAGISPAAMTLAPNLLTVIGGAALVAPMVAVGNFVDTAPATKGVVLGYDSTPANRKALVLATSDGPSSEISFWTFRASIGWAERMHIDTGGQVRQQDGLMLASEPGAAAGAIPIGGMVIGGAPGGTNINGLAEFPGSLTIFATGSGANGTTPAGQKWRNCGALGSNSTVALWVRTA